MIEKKTVFSQVECTKDGTTQIRFEKQIVDNGNVIAMEYHRTVLDPGVNLAEQLALVNTHLATMGYPPAPADVVARVQAIVGVEHTPERIAAFRAARTAAATRG
jgi:hypothetical protein